MDKIVGVILAAGKGTRIAQLRQGYDGQGDKEGSEIPKVMFEANDKPLIGYGVDCLRRAGVDKIALVVGYKKEIVMDYLDGEVEYAVQDKQLGTGHAVMAANDLLKGRSEAVLVCYGDHVLYKPETVQRLVELYLKEKPTIAMLEVIFQDPVFWAFGRIVRNAKGEIIDSVEQKDCNEEQLKIKECNPCFYIFNSDWLWKNLKKLKRDNAQGEYYLTDLVKIAVNQGRKIVATTVSEESEAMGINTPEQLKQAEEILKERTEKYAHI
ncbi:MAG: NTP transferase domain-containing protein [bacterium]|nr:NTP transferase domain-containing protein [bacterium]